MTDIPAEEIDLELHSPQLSLFLFQFSDYAETLNPADPVRPPRSKEKVL